MFVSSVENNGKSKAMDKAFFERIQSENLETFLDSYCTLECGEIDVLRKYPLLE